MDRRRLARPRVRRQLFPQAMVAGLAARRIQAAARGFLARRQLQRRARGLMSPADVRAMKRKPKQGQVKTPGVFPKYRIGTLIGTDRSKRTVNKAKIDPRVMKTHYDYNHTCLQAQVAYFGFQDSGSQNQQLRQGCLALAQMIYRRAGVICVHEDMTINHTNLMRIDAIKIQFQETDLSGNSNHVEDLITDGISTGSTNLGGLASAIVTSVTGRANNGYWPVQLQLLKVGAIDYDIFCMYDLTNVMIHFAAMQKYKYQNITPATGTPDGPSNINDVQANPLSGRIYQFKHPVPKLRALVKENDEKNFPLDNLAKIEDLTASSSEGVLSCEAFRTGTVYNGALKFGFKQPFKAASVFENTTHEDKVYMPPGGYKQLIKKTSVVMNFKRFVIATYIKNVGDTEWIPLGNEPRVPRIGTSTMWALEPAVRTSSNETTKVIINRELWLTAKAVPGKNKQPVRAKTIVQDGSNFGS